MNNLPGENEAVNSKRHTTIHNKKLESAIQSAEGSSEIADKVCYYIFQSMFSLCSVYIQSIFSLYSV